MNTPKPEALAAAKMSRRCWTVLFSVTLAPTLSQFFPVGLSTSIWGSIMTTAVSVLSNFMCGLLLWRKCDEHEKGLVGQVLRKARRSALMVSAWVVGMPWGKSL